MLRRFGGKTENLLTKTDSEVESPVAVPPSERAGCQAAPGMEPARLPFHEADTVRPTDVETRQANRTNYDALASAHDSARLTNSARLVGGRFPKIGGCSYCCVCTLADRLSRNVT